ncbi:MAG: type II secretion system F family protein, partial [Lentisphaeria bacterium]|nr:type II secretion system F family protein [Lentisphaeria bacterium]
MPKFKYVAEDASGKKKKGTVEANNEQSATAKISQRGLFPLEVVKVEENKKVKTKKSGAPKVKGKGFTFSFGKPKMKTKALTVFTRQLATLIGAGLPLLRALKTLERQSANAPASFAIITDIAETVEGGSGFAEALGNHPKTFDRLYVNMVKAGEASGNLEEVLERLAEFKEKAARISTKIKSASMYPAVVFTVATVITVGLMLFIVPKFQQIFADMLGKNEPLPPLTQAVVNASEFMQNHYIIILGVILLVVIGFQLFKKTSGGEYFLHGLVLKIPG